MPDYDKPRPKFFRLGGGFFKPYLIYATAVDTNSNTYKTHIKITAVCAADGCNL